MLCTLLNSSANDIDYVLETIFNNRGIYDIEAFLKCDESSLNDYNLLKNFNCAYHCFMKHLNNKDNFCIVVDCDVDGYSSASIIYKLIKKHNPKINIQYILHEGKEHGLDDVIDKINNDIQVVIVPDAGSNDIDSCKKLKDKNIDVIILDHHNIEYNNQNAIVVNCKDGRYPNQDLCGAGVVLKLLEKYDDDNWTQFSQEYLDIVAIATLADLMELIDKENRYIINKGIYNINNDFIKTMIMKIYNFPEKYTSQDIQMKLIPLINGCIRMGNMEDKDTLFKAFADIDNDTIYERTYRGKTYRENIYEKALRLCTNAKNRQDAIVNKAVPILINQIKKENGFLFCNLSNINIKGIENCTGLIANKLSNKYKKPCIIARINNDGEWSGSARNFTGSNIRSLKDYLSQWSCFTSLQGHDNAFGVIINDTDKLIKMCESETIPERVNYVDFIINSDELNVNIINESIKAQELLGRGYEPIKFEICDLKVNEFQFMGDKNNHWKFTDDIEGISYVKFNNSEDDILSQIFNENWGIPENTYINAFGSVSLNYYNSIVVPQFIIEEYELIEEE